MHPQTLSYISNLTSQLDIAACWILKHTHWTIQPGHLPHLTSDICPTVCNSAECSVISHLLICITDCHVAPGFPSYLLIVWCLLRRALLLFACICTANLTEGPLQEGEDDKQFVNSFLNTFYFFVTIKTALQHNSIVLNAVHTERHNAAGYSWKCTGEKVWQERKCIFYFHGVVTVDVILLSLDILFILFYCGFYSFQRLSFFL